MIMRCVVSYTQRHSGGWSRVHAGQAAGAPFSGGRGGSDTVFSKSFSIVSRSVHGDEHTHTRGFVAAIYHFADQSFVRCMARAPEKHTWSPPPRCNCMHCTVHCMHAISFLSFFLSMAGVLCTMVSCTILVVVCARHDTRTRSAPPLRVRS